ncbi:SH3 domain-containing protein [Hyphomicrobium sp. CS1GBMeth3]|uniref:SH3 domain-containing protein n=1 Tax=Hyphomicrobium sp. CS1GBMeth3 TaxID=1892845 RepID=UPI0011148990|nr:SH3 domain-containing protein [Hyphomicrobium sp. CS1GBMeth3]
MLRPFILIGVLSAATGALAEPVPLGGDALADTVSGSVVEIDTPLGTKVPMRFGKDGLVSAEAGVLAPVLGSAKDRGRWWVDGEKLCTKWFRWFEAQPRCLTIRQEGAKIYWRKIDDGETGTGTLVNWSPPEQKPTVVAKAEPEPLKKAPAPKQEEPAAREEAPPRQEEKVAVLSAPEAPAAEVVQPEPDFAPMVVARAEEPAEASQPAREDGVIMHFGGAGLLEASTRVGDDAGASAQQPLQEIIPAPKRPAVQAREAAKATPKASPETAPATSTKVAVQRRVRETQPTAPKRLASATATGWGGGEATAGASRTTLYRVTGVHRSDVLNVRRGPSEQHAQIGSIPPTGRKVKITGQCRADWCPIQYGRVTGWVNSFYLAEENSRQSSASEVYIARP